MYHVRWRVLNADFNRWGTRDPIGYVDGPNLYLYALSDVIGNVDPLGLCNCDSWRNNPAEYEACRTGCLIGLMGGNCDEQCEQYCANPNFFVYHRPVQIFVQRTVLSTFHAARRW